MWKRRLLCDLCDARASARRLSAVRCQTDVRDVRVCEGEEESSEHRQRSHYVLGIVGDIRGACVSLVTKTL
eukprot:scaffold1531_cov111-Isochrysis_galbana.AAC.3